MRATARWGSRHFISTLPYLCITLIAACAPQQEETSLPPKPQKAAAFENEPGASWQIEDDSTFSVMLQPWPPVGGEPSTIQAELGQGDWSNRDYQARVRFRIAATPDSQTPWQPMVVDHEDDATLYFRHTTSLASGRHYIQFEITRQGFKQPSILNNWYIDVP